MLATGAEFSPTRTNFCREAHVVIQLKSVILAAGLALLSFFPNRGYRNKLRPIRVLPGHQVPGFLHSRPLALDQTIFELQK